MEATSLAVAIVGAMLSVPTLFRVDRSSRLWLLAINFFGTAWAPYLSAAGAIAIVSGVVSSAPFAAWVGLLPFAIGAHTTWAVTRSNDSEFRRAFGPGWRSRLCRKLAPRLAKARWRWGRPSVLEPRHRVDVAVEAVEGTGRGLLCDLWLPNEAVPVSGVVIVYLHGGAWYLMDKDVGTRRFFGHLCERGHVVVDLDYRTCPEVDAIGMVHDAMRTVAWVKTRASTWGTSADRVVLMGASAGGHVALLAAYGAEDEALRPAQLCSSDVTVAGVVSYYGIVDLLAYDSFARRFQADVGSESLPPREGPDDFTRRCFRRLAGRDLDPRRLPPLPPHWAMMRELVGSGAVPSRAELEQVSPFHRVHSGCPPTLHFQPAFDHLQPVEAGRAFRDRLASSAVPLVYVEYPRALHAFDLLIPPLISPAAQSSLYDLDRFLALLAPRRDA